MSDPRIIGAGAGGHARCVIEAIDSTGELRVVALIDSDPQRVGTTLLGRPVVAGDERDGFRSAGVANAFVGVGGVGDTAPRRALADDLRRAGFHLPPIVHATAIIAESARIEDGAHVLAGAIVGPGAVVGRDAIVNAGAIVGHDVVLGEGVHVASGARIAGEASVGAGAHIGTGAIIIQGRTVGEDAIIAAGAVVIDDVGPAERVGGVPARPLSLKRGPG